MGRWNPAKSRAPDVKANPNLSRRKWSFWPVVGTVAGALVALNPFYQPRLTIGFEAAAWLIDLTAVLMLLEHPEAACVVAGLFVALPCFLNEDPLIRAFFMCGMAFPLAMASASLLAPPNATFR